MQHPVNYALYGRDMFGRSEGFTPSVVNLLNMQLLHASSWESYCVVYMLAWRWKWQCLHVDKLLHGNVEDGFVIGSTYISLPDTDATPDAMLFRQQEVLCFCLSRSVCLY